MAVRTFGKSAFILTRRELLHTRPQLVHTQRRISSHTSSTSFTHLPPVPLLYTLSRRSYFLYCCHLHPAPARLGRHVSRACHASLRSASRARAPGLSPPSVLIPHPPAHVLVADEASHRPRQGQSGRRPRALPLRASCNASAEAALARALCRYALCVSTLAAPCTYFRGLLVPFTNTLGSR